MSNEDMYKQLGAPFKNTRFRDGGGRIKLEYIDGEQCITRLNEALGFENWNFRIVEHGIHEEADEAWVLGELSITLYDETTSRVRVITKQQFGSQKLKRPRGGGKPMDIGFDLKGATTDCLKKCATMVGVALYLYNHDEPTVEDSLTPLSTACERCGVPLQAVTLPDGTEWSAKTLAETSMAKMGAVYCLPHFQEAVATKRAAQAG